MRVVFMGTPDFAVAPLTTLISSNFEVVAVYTRPPQKAGRGLSLVQSPVHHLAQAHNIPIEIPATLKTEDALTQLQSYKPDIIIVVAYGMILPQAILDIPPLGCWNIHASLLPRWRGAAPIQRALMAGDAETGVCFMRMETGLDTGPVLASKHTVISADDDASLLHDRLRDMGAQLLGETLDQFRVGKINLTELHPQNDAQASYAARIDKAEARIDWSRPAIDIVNQIRGLAPFPGAWFTLQNTRIKILKAELDVTRHASPGTILDDAGWIACGVGAIRPQTVQRAGKSAMPLSTFKQGMAFTPGTILSCTDIN